MKRPHLDDSLARQIKTASKALIVACGGGAAAATVCRLGESHLSEAASVHHMDRWLPLDVVVALEGVAEALPVTAALAQMQGWVLVPTEPACGAELPLLLARLGREVGEAFGAAGLALAGGEMDAGQRATLVRELGDVVAAGHAAIAALKQGGAP